ncbi:MAG TPA: Calx-beta domain-containing protein [Accumulibacter sp.]|nr:Calx-beta domain-containing protein [Accumulibacter sp.]
MTIAAGATQAIILVPTINDFVTEPTETFNVTLSNISPNASAADSVAVGTILDKGLPELSIADATTTEGDPEGPKSTVTFTVTRSGDNGYASSVDYTVNPGSATTPEDYAAGPDPLSGTLTFAVGETSKTITLGVTNDLVPEGTEQFTVALSNATNATIFNAVATGTIVDNDPVIAEPTIIWRNGGEITIGSAETPSQFNIGTNAVPSTGVSWTGAGTSSNWSESGNWSPSSPLSSDEAIFTGVGADRSNVVDQDFTLAGLHYTGEAGPAMVAAHHITDLNNGSNLAITGNATVGVANPDARISLRIEDRTAVIAHVTDLNVGINTAGTGAIAGSLSITGGGILDASDASNLSIGRETGAANSASTAADGRLTLASNSTLHLGTADALATLNIGWSQNGNYYGAGNATGVLDVLDSAAVLDLHLSELNVGRGSRAGVGTGTLQWNQSEAIAATDVYFGRGYSTGNLVVPTGGEFYLGTEAAPTRTLSIAYNDASNGTATADLDFSQTNPTFTAFIADDLSIGRETGAANSASTAADGRLTLASNSTLHLGTADALATLNIGWSQNGNYYGAGNATGVLDVTEGTLSAQLSELNVGVTANHGIASGEFVIGNGVMLDADTANVGVGSGGTGTMRFVDHFGGSFDAGTVNLAGGLFTFGANILDVGDTGSIVAHTFNVIGGLLAGDTVDLDSDGSGTLQFVDQFTGSFDAVTVNLAGGLFNFGLNTLNVGGPGSIVAETLNLTGGLLAGDTVDLDAGGNFSFTGGRLDVDNFNGTLNENGGTLAPGDTAVGTTAVNGDYNLAASGTLEINIAGTAPGTGYDQLAVNGGVDLDSGGTGGGTLDLVLAFAPQLNDQFTVIENDQSDAVAGSFFGLPNGASLQASFGGYTYTFSIDYAGGDGNDVQLTVSDVTAQAAPLLGAQTASDSDSVSTAVAPVKGDPVASTVLAPPETTAVGSDASTVDDTPHGDVVGTSTGDSSNAPVIVDAGNESPSGEVGPEIIQFDDLLRTVASDDSISDNSMPSDSLELANLILSASSVGDLLSSSSSDAGIDAAAHVEEDQPGDQAASAGFDDFDGSAAGSVATPLSDQLLVGLSWNSVDFALS